MVETPGDDADHGNYYKSLLGYIAISVNMANKEKG